MSRFGLPTEVPCGVCLVRITGWAEPHDDEWVAQPCGHTLAQILDVGRAMTRVPAASPPEPSGSHPCPTTDLSCA